MQSITELLQLATERKAADLYIITGYVPALRINGEIFQLGAFPLLTPELTTSLLSTLISQAQWQKLQATKELDVGLSLPSGDRYRANFYYQKGTLSAAFRIIPARIRTIEELKLPSLFHTFTMYSQGLVLFTGPTGEGKSTSLAALINEINTTSKKNIITIEDPIEYIFPLSQSLVSQREIGEDTATWASGLRAALRQSPDVILLGEMRDYEAISVALTAAETGSLIFSTLHTSSTTETVNRIIDVFPSQQQQQIRSQLASVLKAVVSQRLVPSSEGTHELVPVTEILLNTSAVSSLVREGKAYMLDNVLETGEDEGMRMMEKDLVRLVHDGTITKDTAKLYAVRPNVIAKFLS